MGDRMGSSPIDRTNRKDDNAIVFFSFYVSLFKIFGVYLKYLYAADVPYLIRKKRNFSRRGKFEFTISGKVVK